MTKPAKSMKDVAEMLKTLTTELMTEVDRREAAAKPLDEEKMVNLKIAKKHISTLRNACAQAMMDKPRSEQDKFIAASDALEDAEDIV